MYIYIFYKNSKQVVVLLRIGKFFTRPETLLVRNTMESQPFRQFLEEGSIPNHSCKTAKALHNPHPWFLKMYDKYSELLHSLNNETLVIQTLKKRLKDELQG